MRDSVTKLLAMSDDPLTRMTEQEVLRSEILRMTILGFLFGALALAVAVVAGPFPGLTAPFGFGLPPSPLLMAFPVAGMGYTVGCRRVFVKLLRAGRRPPRLTRYLNALSETLIVTGIVAAVAVEIDPLTAFNAPPTSIYLFVIMLSTLRTDPLISLFTGLACAAGSMTVALSFRAAFPADGPLSARFALQGIKALALVGGSVVAACIAHELRRRFTSQLRMVLEHEYVVNLFGRHVSPQVVAQLLERRQPLAGDVRFVCVLFLDVRGFTAYAEGVAPERAVAYLNALFAVAVEQINRRNGIVNKFLGDGCMAMFGAPLADPRACDQAVAAALAILAEVAALAEAGSIPPTRLGIGIHAGEVVTGSVGAPQRQEYTVIGDSVNLAARIEQLNKECATQLLVSDAVWERLAPEPRQGAELAPMAVKGRAQPVRIHALA